jgi:glycosyltransferase EpsF
MNKKIKVLHIFKNMNRGGAETFIMNVFRNIDREKIQFDFLCTSNEEGSYFNEIRNLGGNIYTISYPSNKHLIRNIKEIVEVIKKNGGYDVIHIPLMFYSSVVCLAAWISRVPKIIVHSHNASESQKNTIFRKIYRLISRIIINIFATDKMSCGEKARDFLFGNAEKIKKQTIIINNAIDVDKFKNVTTQEVNKLKEELNIVMEELIIGNVARFSEQKNHLFFLKLAKYFKKNNINAKIILVGDGELKEEFEEQIRKENIIEYFILAGIRTDIQIFMNMFDVFLMPSLYEGFPVTVVESLASGTPCILSNNISNEVALIKNMVSFLDLNCDLKIWYNNIIDMKNNHYDKNKIKEELNGKGFTIESSVNILEKVYLKK